MAQTNLRKAMVEWATAWAPKVGTAVKSEAPVGKTRQLTLFASAEGTDAQTTLRASIKARAIGTVNSTRIEISSKQSYAIIIKNGRAMVVPRKAKVLHWVNANGQHVYAMKSKAVAPNPYPERGWKKISREAEADLSHRLAVEGLRGMKAAAKGAGLKFL